MTLPIPSTRTRLLATLLTVAALSTGIGATAASAQSATAADVTRYVPHGTSGRHEIARNARGYLANTLRPVQPPLNPATTGQIARQLAIRGALAAATGAASKVVVPVVLVAGGGLLIYELVYGE